jgi:hypothetical protein
MPTYSFFVKNTATGAGITGLTPTWAEWAGIAGSTSLSAPSIAEHSSVAGLYTFTVAPDVLIFGRIDFGSSVTDLTQRYQERVLDPAEAALTAARAANLDQINSTRMGLIDNLTGTRAGNLDNIGGTRMANLDGLGTTVGAIGSAVVVIDGTVDGIAADVATMPNDVWTRTMPPTPSAGTMEAWVKDTDERVWAFTIEGTPALNVLVDIAETVAGICDCVWNRLVTDAWDTNTMGWAVKVLMGVAAKRNVALVGPDGTGSPTYDGDKLVAGRLRVYASKADTLSNSNPIFEVAVGAAYTGDNLTTFRVTNP